MSLDLAHLLEHGMMDGTISPHPIRRHLMVIDGIVGGEGDGPLRPKPVLANTVGLFQDVYRGDAICAKLMGFDPRRLPTIAGSLTSEELDRVELVLNGRTVPLDALTPVLGRAFLPPRGWRTKLGA
jgi:uncharacterized protein (DUF362 family)